MVSNVFKAFVQTKDLDDFVDSLIRLYKKWLKTQVVEDPYLKEIDAL